MHAKVQDLCPVTWNISPWNPNVKIRVNEDTLKIFPTRHQRPIWYWGTHISGWICIHQNYQGDIWTKSGIQYILQSAHFSHGPKQLLSSAFHNWTLGTKYHKNNFLFMCAWLWTKIILQRWYKSPPKFPKKELCNFNELGGTQFPQIDNILEL